MLDTLVLDTIDLHAVTAGVRMITRADGLVGLPGARGDARDRPQADGAIEPVNVFLGPRIITIEGEVHADAGNTAYTNWRATAKVAAQAVRAQKLLKWRTTGSALDLQSLVRVTSQMQIPVYAKGHPKRYEYQMMLRAADPIAYSQTLSSASNASSVAVTNAGDVETWPLISVHGPLNAVQIANVTQGKLLLFSSLNLTAVQTLIVDTNPASRSATVAGVSKMGDLVYPFSQFFDLDAGIANTITISGTGTTGATLLTVQHRAAYTG